LPAKPATVVDLRFFNTKLTKDTKKDKGGGPLVFFVTFAPSC